MRSPIYGHVSISSQWAIIRSTLNRLNHHSIIMWVKSPCLSLLLQFLTVVEWCSKALLPTDWTFWLFGTWILVFHILGIVIPSDVHIFFRRVGIPPTRYYWGWSLSLDGKSLSPPTFGFFMTRHESEFRSHNAQFTITGLYVLQPHLNERYAYIYIYIYVIYIYSQPVAVIPIYNYQATTATSWRKIWLQLGFSVSQSLAIGPLP